MVVFEQLDTTGTVYKSTGHQDMSGGFFFFFFANLDACPEYDYYTSFLLYNFIFLLIYKKST